MAAESYARDLSGGNGTSTFTPRPPSTGRARSSTETGSTTGSWSMALDTLMAFVF